MSELPQITVIQAANIIAKVEKVASCSPNSIAFVVPTPCAPIPKANPLAIGDFKDKSFIAYGPIIPPMIPVMMTNTVVNVGSPPISCDTSIAIGVVMDRGNMLIMKSARKLINCDRKKMT